MEEEGHQQQYYGMLDLSVAPGELAVLAEELAKTSSKVSPGFGPAVGVRELTVPCCQTAAEHL